MFSDMYTLEPDWQRARSTSHSEDEQQGAQTSSPSLLLSAALNHSSTLPHAKYSADRCMAQQRSNDGFLLPSPQVMPPCFPAVTYEMGEVATSKHVSLKNNNRGSTSNVEGKEMVGHTSMINPPENNTAERRNPWWGPSPLEVVERAPSPREPVFLTQGGARYHVENTAAYRGRGPVPLLPHEVSLSQPVYFTSDQGTATTALDVAEVEVADPWASGEWRHHTLPQFSSSPPVLENTSRQRNQTKPESAANVPHSTPTTTTSTTTEKHRGLGKIADFNDTSTQLVDEKASQDQGAGTASGTGQTSQTAGCAVSPTSSLQESNPQTSSALRQTSHPRDSTLGVSTGAAIPQNGVGVSGAPTTTATASPCTPTKTSVGRSLHTNGGSKSPTPKPTRRGKMPLPGNKPSPIAMGLRRPSGSPLSPRPLNRLDREDGKDVRVTDVDASLVVLSSCSSCSSSPSVTMRRNSDNGDNTNTAVLSSIVQKHQEDYKEGVRTKGHNTLQQDLNARTTERSVLVSGETPSCSLSTTRAAPEKIAEATESSIQSMAEKNMDSVGVPQPSLLVAPLDIPTPTPTPQLLNIFSRPGHKSSPSPKKPSGNPTLLHRSEHARPPSQLSAAPTPSERITHHSASNGKTDTGSVRVKSLKTAGEPGRGDSQSSRSSVIPTLTSLSPQPVSREMPVSISSAEAEGEVTASTPPDLTTNMLRQRHHPLRRPSSSVVIPSPPSSPLVKAADHPIHVSPTVAPFPSTRESPPRVKEQQQPSITQQSTRLSPSSLDSSPIQRTPPSHQRSPIRLFPSPPQPGTSGRPIVSSRDSSTVHSSSSPSPEALEEWAESVWQQAEEEKALYRQEIDKVFESRCEQLTAWMLTQARQSQTPQRQQSSQPRPSRSVGTETDQVYSSLPSAQEGGPTSTAVMECGGAVEEVKVKEPSLSQQSTRLKYWEAQSQSWEEKFKRGEKQWQEEREALHQRCADALFRLEEQLKRERSRCEEKSHEVERLKREFETFKDTSRLEIATAIQSQREMARKEEATHWQRHVEEQRQRFEEQWQTLTQRHEADLAEAVSAKTQREVELQKSQDQLQQLSQVKKHYQERLLAHENSAALERDALQKELQYARDALVEERKKMEKVTEEHHAALHAMCASLEEEWKGKLMATEQEHGAVVLRYEERIKDSEQTILQLKAEKALMESSLQTTKKALEARGWNVTEAFDAWQQRASETQRKQLEEERVSQETLVRERCEALLTEYFEKVAKEEAARHQRLLEDHRAFYAELSQIQAKEREQNEKRRRELERETMEQARQMAEESQTREAAQRVRLSQREDAVAERERAYVSRLASAEAEAVERGRSVVEAEILKARVDLQQRYSALRNAQQSWDESCAAWERETAANYATRFEKAKVELTAGNTRLLSSLMSQLEEREAILLQERASVLQHCIQSFQRRSELLSMASHHDIQALQEAEEAHLQEREETLMKQMLTSREAVVTTLEERSRAILVGQAELLKKSHELATHEAQERLAALQDTIRENMKGAMDARQDFENRLLQRMEAAMKEEQQRMTQLLEAQRDVYRGGLETLQQRWKESEKIRTEALEASRREERRAWEESVAELEQQYLHQYQQLQQSSLERVRQLEQQQEELVRQIRSEHTQRLAEVEETNDIQTREMQQMYELRLQEMESERQKRVEELHQRWKEVESTHLAQRGALQHRLEEAYQHSLIQLRQALEEREKAAVVQQRGEQLYVEDRMKTIQAELVSRYDQFTQQLSKHSRDALEQHRSILLSQQQELEAQLVAIREQLSVALVNHLSKVESQELQLQSQQTEHLETEMQQLALLLEERERRKAAERQLQEVMLLSRGASSGTTPPCNATPVVSSTSRPQKTDVEAPVHTPAAAEEPTVARSLPMREKVPTTVANERENTTSVGSSSIAVRQPLPSPANDSGMICGSPCGNPSVAYISERFNSAKVLEYSRTLSACSSVSKGSKDSSMTSPPPKPGNALISSGRERDDGRGLSPPCGAGCPPPSQPLHLNYREQRAALLPSHSHERVPGGPPPQPVMNMEVLFPQLEELWDLLEVPESEQAQVHHWLGALAMTTPVDVSRARQMDIVHWEVQRLASYIPLLELVAQRQVLLEELAQHQDEEDENSKDHVVLLGKELSTLQCDLVERITQNEKYYRKPLTFRGERVMDLIMSVKG